MSYAAENEFVKPLNKSSLFNDISAFSQLEQRINSAITALQTFRIYDNSFLSYHDVVSNLNGLGVCFQLFNSQQISYNTQTYSVVPWAPVLDRDVVNDISKQLATNVDPIAEKLIYNTECPVPESLHINLLSNIRTQNSILQNYLLSTASKVRNKLTQQSHNIVNKPTSNQTNITNKKNKTNSLLETKKILSTIYSGTDLEPR